MFVVVIWCAAMESFLPREKPLGPKKIFKRRRKLEAEIAKNLEFEGMLT
jgi:hypothetical protein